MSADVSVESVVLALRRIRPGVYRVERAGSTTTVALVLRVSASGRRNAAERIVTALADSGLELVAEDPITALATGGGYRVIRLDGPCAQGPR